MTTATAQIAKHLNVVENAIVRVEKWAKVLFVVVKGLGARFVSKKVIEVKNIGLTGYELPPGVSFDLIEDELEWLDNQSGSNDWDTEVNEAIGEIAKYLPLGSNPSEANLLSKARQVTEGTMSAQEAANQLSNKKVIIKRGSH